MTWKYTCITSIITGYKHAGKKYITGVCKQLLCNMNSYFYHTIYIVSLILFQNSYIFWWHEFHDFEHIWAFIRVSRNKMFPYATILSAFNKIVLLQINILLITKLCKCSVQNVIFKPDFQESTFTILWIKLTQHYISSGSAQISHDFVKQNYSES